MNQNETGPAPKPVALPEGELYGVNDPESLNAEDPWTAVEEYLDGAVDWAKGMGAARVEAEIRALCPIDLVAYKRDEIGDDEIKAWADDLTDTLSEKWGDEYGDPDGNWSMPDDATDTMRTAVTKIVRAMTVWRCADAGRVSLSADYVVRWARDERPDWFDWDESKEAVDDV